MGGAGFCGSLLPKVEGSSPAGVSLETLFGKMSDKFFAGCLC